MTVINAKAVFAAARRTADNEREHPHWSCALRDLQKLIAYAEELVGPHPGVLPTVEKQPWKHK